MEVDPKWGHQQPGGRRRKKETAVLARQIVLMCARREIRMSNSETKAMTGRKFHCLVSSTPIELWALYIRTDDKF